MGFRWPLAWRSSYDWAMEGWHRRCEMTIAHIATLDDEIARLNKEVAELRGREAARDAMVRQVEKTFFFDCVTAGEIAVADYCLTLPPRDPDRPSINMSLPMGLRPCSGI